MYTIVSQKCVEYSSPTQADEILPDLPPQAEVDPGLGSGELIRMEPFGFGARHDLEHIDSTSTVLIIFILNFPDVIINK